MFTMFLERPTDCVVSVDELYNNLQWGAVKSIINADLMNLCGATLVGEREHIADQTYMFQIGINTKYGATVLSDVPTSFKIIILALLSKKNKKSFCFDVSLLGANYVPYLLRIAQDTDLLTGFASKGRFVMCNKDYKRKYCVKKCRGA